MLSAGYAPPSRSLETSAPHDLRMQLFDEPGSGRQRLHILALDVRMGRTKCTPGALSGVSQGLCRADHPVMTLSRRHVLSRAAALRLSCLWPEGIDGDNLT